MSTPGSLYFGNWRERLSANPPLVWCKSCGHVEGAHFDDWVDPWSSDPHERCHHGKCDCTEFVAKKRKNRLKFFLTGKG